MIGCGTAVEPERTLPTSSTTTTSTTTTTTTTSTTTTTTTTTTTSTTTTTTSTTTSSTTTTTFGWETLNSGTTKDLNDIHALDDNNAIAVGIDGTVLTTTDRGDTWNTVTSFTTLELKCVSEGGGGGGSSPTTYIGGAKGNIFKSTDWASWETCNKWTSSMIRDLSVMDTATAAAISSSDGSKRFRVTEDGGTTWDDIGSPTNANRAIFFPNLTFGYAVGNNGAIEQYLGVSWEAKTSGTSVTLRAINAYGPNSVFVVGNDGTILFSDGSTWVTQESTTIQNLNAITRPEENTAWAAGLNGTILYTEDGGTWTSQESGTTEHLYGVSAPSEGGLVYAAGEGGTILRLIY